MGYTKEQILAMSPEERSALKKQLEAEVAGQAARPTMPRPTLGQSLGKALLMGTQAYTTGQIPKEAYESLSPATSAEPDWYTKQQIEQEQKLALEKEKARLTAEQEQEFMESLPGGEYTQETIRTPTGRTLKRVNGEAELEAEAKQLAKKEAIKGEAMVSREREKKKMQADIDFEVARNKLRTTAAAFKAMAQKSGGMGRIPGLIGGKLGGVTGLNPYTNAYTGQLNEAAAALAKLASPSARVGKDIIQIFEKTLPSVTSTEGEFLSQIRFSLHNAFAMALANREEEYTPELREEVDRMVDEIMNVPPMSVEDMERAVAGKSIGGTGGGQIDVIAPNGQEGSIPAEDLDEALRQGYRRK